MHWVRLLHLRAGEGGEEKAEKWNVSELQRGKKGKITREIREFTVYTFAEHRLSAVNNAIGLLVAQINMKQTVAFE